MARALLFVKDMFSFFQSKLMMIPLSRSVLQDRKSPLPATQISLSDAKPPRVTASQAGMARTELPALHPDTPLPPGSPRPLGSTSPPEGALQRGEARGCGPDRVQLRPEVL